jgi:hypothetical protein
MQLAQRVRRCTPRPWILALPVLLALSAIRPSIAQVAVPPELRGWEDWVLHGHEAHRCPWLVPGGPARDEQRICAWPSALDLQVDERGARFSQHWQVAAESWLPLPGNTENWPDGVTADGTPAALVAHEGAPTVRVAPGAHTLAGVFHWARRPELLPLPPSVGLVTLTLNGTRVLTPQRSNAGVILGAQSVARQDDHLDLRVFRRLDDALPALLTTQLHLAIAGEAREVRLPRILPEGFVPISLEGALTARLDPDGTLRVQVRPGTFELAVEARGPSPVAEVRLGSRPAPWPAQEVWSFQSEDRLRVAAIEGVAGTDPAQANVPQGWRDLPAYRLDPASVLRVVERSRGLSAQDANELRLQRTAWLDFSGAGYTVVDALSGRMRQGWRLDMDIPYILQSARTQSGESLLVTAGAASGLTGVEVREPKVALSAVSRIAQRGGALPATGWRTRFVQVAGQLVMAPGYRLLAAFGPDSAPEAWLERWRLLDIFAVLLIGTVAWRILGVRTALIALAAIGLTYQEGGSPTWLWLNVLIALALLRAAPAGRLRTWAAAYRLLGLGAVLLALVPFAITQVRLAVYPQLEALLEAMPAPVASNMAAREKDERHYKVAAPASAAVAGLSSATRLSRVTVTGARATEIEEAVVAQEGGRYEPGALVQAGPGLPDWSYHVYHYSWNGPVERDATARFLVSPPWMTRLWRVLGVILSVLLLYELAAKELLSLPAWWRSQSPAGAAVVILGLALTFGAPSPARASGTPDPALLKELQTRLLEPPRCAPDCADVLSADVSVGAARLTIMLTVSALDGVGVALPGAEPNWIPDLVQVDGAAAGGVYRSPQGVRYLTVARGRHVVRVEGALPALDALALAFPLRPHVIDVTAPGWDVGGVSERHLVSGALELARRSVVAGSSAAPTPQEEFPAFVSVDRLFHLAHDWVIETTVARVAPKSSAFTVSLPLLAQEAVTTPGVKAERGLVPVGLAAGEASRTFTSILPHTNTLELVATAAASHAEHWRFEVGANWHVEFSGVPPVAPEDDSEESDGVWTFEYYPRPGERLKLNVTRPTAAGGGTVAFDHVRLQTRVGKRSSDTALELQYRSTQGGRQTLRIPPGAVVTRVLSDGDPLALRPENGELSLSALPGNHTWSVNWQTSTGEKLITRSPQVTVAAPASNLQLSLRLPEDRWVLYVFGPGVGPTILYWGELLLFVVVAWLLGRTRLTPLATRDWLLLGLGLSTFSWLALGVFIVFIAVFEWRARYAAPADPQRFNLLQLGSGVLAVIALLAVVTAVPKGLLAHPDMRILPDGGELAWFVDQSSGALPSPGVLSVSLWWYKIAMLAWALWLSFALTRWTRWAWGVFASHGLWRARTAITSPSPPAPPPASQG